MDNPLVRSLAGYLIAQCEEVFARDPERPEVRLCLASFEPRVMLEAFDRLYAHLVARQGLHVCLKVGRELWLHWKGSQSAPPDVCSAFEKRDWIDQRGTLTALRNRPCGELERGQVLVLGGIDRVPDKTGLDDFHRVDEATLWERAMGRSYESWLRWLMEAVALEPSASQLAGLEEVLAVIDKATPRDLSHHAVFLKETASLAHGFSSGSELLDHFVQKLPRWGLFPLAKAPATAAKRKQLITSSMEVAARARFIDTAERKRALQRVESYLAEPSHRLPEPVGVATGPFADADSFASTLIEFINYGTPQAREMLAQVDFAVIHEILTRTGPKSPPSPKKDVIVTGPAQQALMAAVWQTAVEHRRGKIPAPVAKVRVTLKNFYHDLEGDDGESAGEAAAMLRRGLLGGVEGFLAAEAADGVGLELVDEIEGEVKCKTDTNVAFEVSLLDEMGEALLLRKFRWLVGAAHEERVLHNLARVVKDKLASKRLPVFTINTFQEVFFASDTDEANRLLAIGEAEFDVQDLAAGEVAPILDAQPVLRALVSDLCLAYQGAIRSLVQDGYFHALGKPVLSLIAAVERLYEHLLEQNHLAAGDLGCALFKAFLIVPPGTRACDVPLPAAIATGLSPAVLEQLQGREHYLRQAFPRLLARLLADDADPRELSDLFGRVGLHRPLLALLRDQHPTLTTHSRGFGQVHLLGELPEGMLGLVAQANMREEDVDDDDVDDRELFALGPEAKVYRDQLWDYFRSQSQARDGMSVLAIDVEDIQALVAGVHHFLRQALAETERPAGAPPFEFGLRIYLRSASDASVRKWLEAWQRRWDPARGKAIYPNCRLALAFLPARRIADYMRMVADDGARYDVAFVVRFLRAPEGGGDHVEATEPFDFNDGSTSLKFPITEAPRPATKSVQAKWKRQTNLSNRRLHVASLHAELAARIQKHFEKHHLVFATVDFEPWIELIDRLHAGGRCNWVVCVDPNIDRELLAASVGSAGAKRELVGFASGLGGLGELNVTVSTEASSTGALVASFAARLRGIFKSWSKEAAELAASGIVAEASRLAGFSLIRAVTVSNERYIHEVVAQALVRKAYVADPTALCDVLLSIDGYGHWMAGRRASLGNYRPDHIHLVARLDHQGEIAIEANVIECKLALSNNPMLDHARVQVEVGLEVLVQNFLPGGHGHPRDAFSRRYWWAQLQRAIAAHSRVDAGQAGAVARALEHLGEGRYSITWRGTVATFWTDVPAVAGPPQCFPGPEWEDLGIAGMPADFTIGHLALGSEAIAALAVQGTLPPLPSSRAGRLVAGSTRRGTAPLEAVVARTVDQGLVGDGDAWRGAPATGDASGACRPDNAPTEPTYGDSETTTLSPTASGLATTTSSVTGSTFPPSAASAPATAMATAAAQATASTAPAPATSAAAVAASDETAKLGAASAPDAAVTPTVKAVQPAPIPPRILLGTGAGNQPVYWEFGHPGLTNRHLLIFGRSGSGKTYAIKCLLAEFARAGQHAAIVDYTNGFKPSSLDPELKAVANPYSHFVIKEPLPINPLRPIVIDDPDLDGFVESPHATAGRVMSVFSAVYNLGDQQKSKLVDAVKAALAERGPAAALADLLPALEAQDGATAASAQTIVSKIRPFIEANVFGPGDGAGWQRVFEDPEHFVHIVQLAYLSSEYARIATEFTLWDLWSFATSGGSEQRPLPVVLDEAQTLSHDIDAPVGKILREGRKFGLAGIFATQTISNLKADEQAQLFQASHKLFFAPAETEIKEYAKLLATITPEPQAEWMQRLGALQKGECWSYGPALAPSGDLRPKATRVKITPLGERGLVEAVR